MFQVPLMLNAWPGTRNMMRCSLNMPPAGLINLTTCKHKHQPRPWSLSELMQTLMSTKNYLFISPHVCLTLHPKLHVYLSSKSMNINPWRQIYLSSRKHEYQFIIQGWGWGWGWGVLLIQYLPFIKFSLFQNYCIMFTFNGLVQGCSNSSALAMELL